MKGNNKTKQTSQTITTNCAATPIGGVPVRTNLRASLAWDDLDVQVGALWGKLSNAVTEATSALTGRSDTSTSTRNLAPALGMTGYFANTLPEAKADTVAPCKRKNV